MMQMELKYMVSQESMGVILAGFNSYKDVWDYCNQRHNLDEIFRISYKDSVGGIHTTVDIIHNEADSLRRWVQNIDSAATA